MNVMFMRRALDLAARGKGWVSPNPMVGAVLVNEGVIVGEGFHQKAGGPHAEIYCLNQAKELAKGGTLYLTLEPCSHFGRTPPCVDAILKAGVSKVVVAMEDPNPLVSGRGIKRLEDNGVKVVRGVMEEEARRLNEVFIKFITTEYPFVVLKTASTMDGKIASTTGSSKWITSDISREFVHELRHEYDAILVGINTILTDDPILNCRVQTRKTKDPIRIILDSALRIPLTAKVIMSGTSQSMVFTLSKDKRKIQQLQKLGVEIVQQSGNTNIDLHEMLRYLAKKEISSVLVEGGSEVNWSFVAGGLVDKFYWFITPKIIGGTQSFSAIGGLGIKNMEDAIKLRWSEIKYLGEDLLIIGYKGL